MMKKKCRYQLVIILLIFIASTLQSLGAEGEGEGGGQNQDTPLSLVSCSIQDGQKNVPVDTTIRLEFSKNVVNMVVAESNKKCFGLIDDTGIIVPVDVQMGDDQVDPTIKRIITIEPKASLEEGKDYILTISGELTAKNGTSLGAPIRISFQTVDLEGSDIQSSNKTGDGTSDVTSSAAATDSDIKTSTGTAGGVAALEQDPASGASTNGLYFFGVEIRRLFSTACFIAAAVLLIIYAYRRKKK